MTGYEADARDPGSDAERTDLAWNRSGLALLGCGAAVLRGIGRQPLTSGNLAVGLCIVGLAGVTLVLETWTARRFRTRGPRATTTADLFPISLGVSFVGIAAFVLAILAPR